MFERKISITILFLTFLLSCKNNQVKNIEILIDSDMIAKGKINTKDTSYEGKISFFSVKTGSLLKERTFVNNVLNGQARDYYLNGKIKIESEYKNGLGHGNYTLYDSISSSILRKGYVYFGLEVGSITKFMNNKPIEYVFQSFDLDELYKLNYNDIGQKSLIDLNSNIFLITRLRRVDDKSIGYRVYNIQPPNYSLDYYLCSLNENGAIKDTIKYFSDKKEPWFLIPSRDLDSNSKYSILVNVTDSINKKDCVLIKKLE